MSADQFWIAEAIKEARQNIAMDGGSHFHRITVHLSDELEQARIELEDERERVNVQREDIRTLRMEVQRLTERNVSMEAEIRILTEEARRSDAGRVEVPERAAWLTIEEMATVLLDAGIALPAFAMTLAQAVTKASSAKGSSLSPSPQPAAGAVGGKRLFARGDELLVEESGSGNGQVWSWIRHATDEEIGAAQNALNPTQPSAPAPQTDRGEG